MTLAEPSPLIWSVLKIGTADDYVALRDRFGGQERLARIGPDLEEVAAAEEHAGLLDVVLAHGAIVRHLDLGGRRVPLSASLARARELAERVVGTYGARALEAERNAGADWKALAHAVRVGREALELLASGRIGFPLACAPHLLAIRRGEVPYAAVAAEIEDLVRAIDAAAAASPLPDEPDRAFIEGLVVEAYGRKVLASLRRGDARRAADGGSAGTAHTGSRKFGLESCAGGEAVM